MTNRFISAIILIIVFSTPVFSQSKRNLSIGEMFELVEKNSRELKYQRSGIDAANEGIKAAKGQQLPDINVQLNGSYIGNALLTDRNFSNVQGLKSPHIGNQFVLDVRQTIYAGGAVCAGIEIAKLGAEQAQLGMQLNRENQRFMVLGQYLDLQKIANREKVIESNILLTQKLIDNINEKQKHGVALKNDITRYELQMQTLRLNLTKLRNSRSILNHQLCNTLGIENTEIEPADNTSETVYEKDGESVWQTVAGTNSQQIQMAKINEDIARQKIKLAKSELMPKISVVANNDFNGPITFELPPIDKNLNIWYVGVGIHYSLSGLYKSNKKLSQAKILGRQAEEQSSVVKEQLNNQIQAAYTNYMQSYVELDTQVKNVELANENYNVINERYLNQLALITDMLDASNMKLDAELSEVDARINISYAYYKMKYISGQL